MNIKFYIFKRISLLPIALLSIILLNFCIIQFVPGGPIEQMVAKLQGFDQIGINPLTDTVAETVRNPDNISENSFSLVDQEIIESLKKQYGFDQPAYQRFFNLLYKYLHFDLGTAFFQNSEVIDLIFAKLPISISLGLWSVIIIYSISIPLGIKKSINNNSVFDNISSTVLTVIYAFPTLLLAIILIILFAGGSYWKIFPLRGLISENFNHMNLFEKIIDYIWHLILPITCIVINGLPTLTMLTKNSFLNEINHNYVQTARAKGLTENKVLYGHVFKNAMLIVISSFPATLISMLFTSSLLIEIIFSLDGLGLLSYEAIIRRDYPIVFGCLFFFTLIGMIVKLIGDLLYLWVDPRIDFNSKSS